MNRIYDDRNATIWTEQLYGAQVFLDLRLEFLLQNYDTLRIFSSVVLYLFTDGTL